MILCLWLFSSNTETVISTDPSCQISILDNLNINNKDALLYWSDTLTWNVKPELVLQSTTFTHWLTRPCTFSIILGIVCKPLTSFLHPLLHCSPASLAYLLWAHATIISSPVGIHNYGSTLWRYKSAGWHGFRDFLVCCPWNSCCFSSGVFMSLYDFKGTVLEATLFFVPPFSGLRKVWPPEEVNRTCDRVARLKYSTYRSWRRSLSQTSSLGFAQTSDAIERVKNVSYASRLGY